MVLLYGFVYCTRNAFTRHGSGTAKLMRRLANSRVNQAWSHSGSSFQSLGKCLDVASAGTANGTKVQLYDCNGTAAQQWTVNSARELVNTGSGKCLDATNQSSADGTPLQIWTCAGTANQLWTLN